MGLINDKIRGQVLGCANGPRAISLPAGMQVEARGELTSRNLCVSDSNEATQFADLVKTG